MEPLTLAVDSVDSYKEDMSTFYIHPCRLQTLRCVENNTLESCRIQNSPVSDLTGFNLIKILEKLKPNAPVEVIIDQPVTVMQEYDAKQIEANAKLAGFENVESNPGTYTNPEGKEVSTIIVSFNKPEKMKSNIEVEITTTTKVRKEEPKKKGKR